MDKEVIIIAEAGVNHNGDLDKALLLIESAANAGANYVKFQTFKAGNLVSKNAKKATYQIDNTSEEGTQFEMLKKLEIPEDWYPILIQKASDCKIKFLSTGFDNESINFLDQFNPSFYKIPSGEITNKPYLVHIASKGKPVVISTGMCTLEEIEDAVHIIETNGITKENITVLHCNTQYPTPMGDVNLRAMNTIGDALGVNIGYSDHTLGIEVPIAAVALGAVLIEKHFTLDRNLPGPDHLASLDPSELHEMVKGIRNIEKAISGDGVKQPSNSEKENIKVARKSIHWANSLNAGDTITENDLIMLRPGDGISPMKVNDLIGRKLNCNVQEYCKTKMEEIV